MKKFLFLFSLLILISCNKREKPCDTSVDWDWSPNREFGYLDSVEELSFLHNSHDTIKLSKQIIKESFHTESYCGSNCMMANACPTIYKLNVITTTFKNQQDYQLSVSNDFSLPASHNNELPFDTKIFQFNQVKATIENTTRWKPRPPYGVDSNINLANKFYPFVYTFSDKGNLLLVSNDLKVLKFIDSVKQDTLIALFP